MKLKTLRLGLIGCGHIAQVHMHSLLQLREAGLEPLELALACDVEPERAELFRRNYGFQKIATDLRQMFDAKLDALYVCSPTGEHLQPVLLAAQHGLPLFCEKPLGRNLAEVEQMCQAVERANLHAQLGLVLRFSPVYQVMRHLLNEPQVGRPMAAVFRDDQYFPIGGSYASNWRSELDVVGAGCLLEHSIHDLDLLRWFFGEVTRVEARTDYFSGRAGIEDSAVLMLEFESSARATLVSLWHQMMGRESNRNLELFCERRYLSSAADFMGTIQCQEQNGPATTISTRAVDRMHRKLLGRKAPPGELAHNPYLLENLSFLRSLRTGGRPYPDFATGLSAHRIVDAAYRSARERQPVSLYS